MNHVKDERSLSSLFSDLRGEMQRLVRDEISLFKLEMSHKVTRGMKDISFLAVGAGILYGGFLAMIAGAIILLGTAIAVWISAFVIGAVVLAIGASLVLRGVSELKRTDFTPRETLSTLKGDKEWLKKRT